MLRCAMATAQFSRCACARNSGARRLCRAGHSIPFVTSDNGWHRSWKRCLPRHPAAKFLTTSLTVAATHQINQICLKNGCAFRRSAFSSSCKAWPLARSSVMHGTRALPRACGGKSRTNTLRPQSPALLCLAFPVPLDSRSIKPDYFAIILTMPDSLPHPAGGCRHSARLVDSSARYRRTGGWIPLHLYGAGAVRADWLLHGGHTSSARLRLHHRAGTIPLFGRTLTRQVVENHGAQRPLSELVRAAAN